MRYRIWTFDKSGRFTLMFNNEMFPSVDNAVKALKFWYDARRSDQSKQFVITTDSEIMATVKKVKDKVNVVYNDSTYPYEPLEKAKE